MKAIILAAGFGMRLKPHTDHIPKPLFPISGRPLIDITIQQLIHAGATEIFINVHHRHDKITSFVNSQPYPVPVTTCYEKTILGTGGAIKNISRFMDNHPFIVINSDILTDIDLRSVYDYHHTHPGPVTLVMHDYPIYNNVRVGLDGNIIDFSSNKKLDIKASTKAFTGIQVLDPTVPGLIPEQNFISSIDVYKKMLASGLTIKAYTATNHYWRDIGTPDSYFEAVYYTSVSSVFRESCHHKISSTPTRTRLSGDGSDRKWYRVKSDAHSLIMVDHGINASKTVKRQAAEVDSFILIGRHLYRQGIPVPEIYHCEAFAGIVYLQDLDDTHLQQIVQQEKKDNAVIEWYRKVIDRTIRMSTRGAESFDPAWTYQTPIYDKQMILEKECRYFVEAFLNNFLHKNTTFEDLKDEFGFIADQAIENGVLGFMHRDLQSRNIMVCNDQIYFIDFQGGRIGPIQYDLASLITDPYVNLPLTIQDKLLDYSLRELKKVKQISEDKFRTCYNYCAITRILQSLGAFGHLTLIKNKPFFRQYIPIALGNLSTRLAVIKAQPFPLLTEIVKDALMLMDENPE